LESDYVESEQDAIARLKGGDLEGMETLVHRYQLQAIRVVYLITGELAAAEDIVQAAFLRAAERIHQFDDRRPFGPWFLRSVINDAIKAANRQNRQVSLDTSEEIDPLKWLTDPTISPEEQVQAKEIRQAVKRALDQLSPKQRAVVVMHYYLEMDQADMGKMLDNPVGTIKWRLHTARKRLRNLLGPLMAIDTPVTERPVKQETNRKWRKR
jgi:RNA polymerase sigma-70 factor (ECF subfamily)